MTVYDSARPLALPELKRSPPRMERKPPQPNPQGAAGWPSPPALGGVPVPGDLSSAATGAVKVHFKEEPQRNRSPPAATGAAESSSSGLNPAAATGAAERGPDDPPANIDPSFNTEEGLERVEQRITCWRNKKGQLVNERGERVDAMGRLTRARGDKDRPSAQRARDKWWQSQGWSSEAWYDWKDPFQKAE
jgi:hypothetical protein